MYEFTEMLFSRTTQIKQEGSYTCTPLKENDIEMNMLNYSHQTIQSDLICSWQWGVPIELGQHLLLLQVMKELSRQSREDME